MGMRKLHFWGPVWNLSYTSEFPIVQSYLNKIKHEQTDKAICVFTLKNKKKKNIGRIDLVVRFVSNGSRKIHITDNITFFQISIFRTFS